MSESKSLTFSYQARYQQLGEVSEETEEVWVVCHGYGQLAPYFVNHFRELASPRRVIVAPEGLNRFYLRGFEGRVGATWMTKEERLVDIRNYLEYLETLLGRVLMGTDPGQIKVTLFGFSQGSATASRWLVHSRFHIHRLFLWAGIFPPDMSIPQSKKKLEDVEVHFVYGSEDPFLSKHDRVAEQRAIAQTLGVEPIITRFEGEHVIDRDTLLKLA